MVLLASAGLAGPAVFAVLVVLQGWLNPDYDDIQLPISALAAWPSGWIQELNFFMLAMLLACHAMGLHSGIPTKRSAFLGPGLLIVGAVGLLFAGAFPIIRGADGRLIEPAGHAVGAILTFSGVGSGFVVLSRRMATDPMWRTLAGYTLYCGIAILALFVLMATLAVPENGPLHSWFGLLQRVVVAVWFLCMIVLSLKLFRLSTK